MLNSPRNLVGDLLGGLINKLLGPPKRDPPNQLRLGDRENDYL